MRPEGMVDALEEIHRLLRRSGTLIEIHPVHGAWVEVHAGADVAFVESDPGFDPDDDLGATERALSAIVRRGRFVIARSQEFDFLTYASSVSELREYFAMVGGYGPGPTASVTRLRDRLYGRAVEVLDRAGDDAELVYRERVRISQLIPAV
jgi:hypothetical protein